MTMTLTDRLKEKESQRRAAEQAEKAEATRRHRDLLARAKSLDEYRALVARNAEPGESDGAAMDALMTTLGLTPDDVLGDIDAVAEAERLAAFVQTHTPEAAQAAYDAASREVVAGWRALIVRLAGEVPEEWLPNFMRVVSAATYQMLPHALATGTAAGPMLENVSTGEERLFKAKNEREAAIAAHGRNARRLEELKAEHPHVFGEPEAIGA